MEQQLGLGEGLYWKAKGSFSRQLVDNVIKMIIT